MSREEIQKLLGGYATGTLSDAEQRTLFEAALEDQELFDALAKEQALRDVMQDPFARGQLLDALGPASEPLAARAWRWLRQPAALATAGGLAALLIVAGLALRQAKPPAHREVLVAQAPKPPAQDIVSAPAEVFEPPPPKRKAKKLPLPTPPAIHERANIAGRLPAPAPAAPAPGLPHSEQKQTTQTDFAGRGEPTAGAGAASLTISAASALQSTEIARQLYDRPNQETLTMRTGDMAKARAKPMLRNGAASPQASNLGVRYSVLLRGPDGEYAPARLDAVFHVGDAVRLRLEPNDGGYVYLFQRNSTGGLRLASTQHVERGQTCNLPAGGPLQYDEPGRKQLLLVFSRRQQPELAALATAELEALASGARRHILQAAASSEESAYVVDARLEPAQQKVAFEITLEYR